MSQTPDTPRFVDQAQRYRLGSRIATGGMGEVWRAEDTVLGRTVAVKLLKTEYADDASFRTRFESEARNAAALHHPNVAAVFDYGQVPPSEVADSPRPYLVMELVDGKPLSDLIKRGHPMDPDAMRELLAQAADAIGAAHAAGIVHRDVKPANLLVTPDRRVKITDFGIARATEGMALTQTGQVMGTPQYLSPEQAQGRGATPASDVYSLGVVAFECLAGHRPFEASSPVATALAHVREPVPDLPDDIPADLAAVVYKTMEKDPKDRFADGQELATALRDPATAATQIVGAGAGPGSDAGRTAVLPGAAAGAGLGAAAGYAAGRGSGSGSDTAGLDAQDAAARTGGAAGPGGAAGTGGPGPTSSRATDDGARTRSNPVWLWVLLAVAAVVIVVLLLTRLGGDDEPTDTPTPPPNERPSQTREPTQEPTQEPTPEPTQEPTQEPTPEPTQEPSSPQSPSNPETQPSGQDPTDPATPGAPSSAGESSSGDTSPSVSRVGGEPSGHEAGDTSGHSASRPVWRGDR